MIDKIIHVWTYLNDNWALVALVVSEVAAFLPTKWNGIFQSILKIGAKLFTKKSRKS
jgi:hypothetical protein